MLSRTRTGLNALVKLGAVFVVIVLGSCLVFGQGSAAISGVVRDTTGALVPGVSVAARQTDTGQTRTAVSDEYGGCHLQTPPGGPFGIAPEPPRLPPPGRAGLPSGW